MLKLYRFDTAATQYWETWEEESGTHIFHWGELGTQGDSKTIQSAPAAPAEPIIQEEIDGVVRQGFQPLDDDDHAMLLIEYTVDGMGTPQDLEKRHRLEGRMNETLGWTGLGYCDGGSIGSGTMEVCCFVVDFELAKTVIERDLADTEFADYARIFDEGA